MITTYRGDELDALFTQDSPRIPGVAEPHDHFGWAVATGDWVGGGEHVAAGVPGEDVGGIVDAGALNVIYEVEDQLGLGNQQLLTQAGNRSLGGVEPGDRFGTSLGVGDFKSDTAADLVTGIPFEDVGSAIDAGAATVHYGEVGQGHS